MRLNQNSFDMVQFYCKKNRRLKDTVMILEITGMVFRMIKRRGYLLLFKELSLYKDKKHLNEIRQG
jgi:hypothetical protein